MRSWLLYNRELFSVSFWQKKSSQQNKTNASFFFAESIDKHVIHTERPCFNLMLITLRERIETPQITLIHYVDLCYFVCKKGLKLSFGCTAVV